MNVANEAELIEAVRACREKGQALEIVGHGTKRDFGRPSRGEILDVSAICGIVSYEPEELIVTVRPATPLAELESVLAQKGQRLGFDPPEWAPLFGAGTSTVGGVVSVDASGPTRIRHGAARDQLLGIRAVNGFGEAFKAGGRVVKNVTGFDIPKLVCGAFGTLCVLTELTLRVFPRPAHAAVLAARNLDPASAFDFLRRIWSSPLDPTALAYVPGETKVAGLREEDGTALFRFEGARAPLAEKLAEALKLVARSDTSVLEDGDAAVGAIANGAPFFGEPLDVWHVHVPPSSAPAVAASLIGMRWYADWAGALFWVGTAPGEAAEQQRVRRAAESAGGHAILVRADCQTRMNVPVFPVEPPEHAALTRAVKQAFDPLTLFNRGRMFEGL